MTNETIPAEPAREIVAAMRAAMRRDEHDYPDGQFLSDMSDYIRALETLLQPRPKDGDVNQKDDGANQKEYRVIWEIDVDADNPTDAAEKALRVMNDAGRGPDDANVFHVHAHGDNERLRIDLGESDD